MLNKGVIFSMGCEGASRNWHTLGNGETHRLSRSISAPLSTCGVLAPLLTLARYLRGTCTAPDMGQGTWGVPAPLQTLARVPEGYLYHSRHCPGYLRETCTTPDTGHGTCRYLHRSRQLFCHGDTNKNLMVLLSFQIWKCYLSPYRVISFWRPVIHALFTSVQVEWQHPSAVYCATGFHVRGC